MAVYAIGDSHGCARTLEALLETIEYEPRADQLYLTGDLVNRGPDSLGVLRWAVDQGDRVVAVLGNHDLHLLARSRGLREPRPGDTFDEILADAHADDWLSWLTARPFLHRGAGACLIHAGLLPQWSLDDATRHARAIEAEWASDPTSLLESIYAPGRDDWTAQVSKEGGDESGPRALHAAMRALVSIRTCTSDGKLCDHSGPPDEAPPGCRPWFEYRPRVEDELLVFG
ncbi:MAG: symmetrical bis(5'-nucleosyl)-tetraphosphatase, partial [Planctomycetota bacterium]